MTSEEINKRFKEIVEAKIKKPKSNFLFLFVLIIIFVIIALVIWKYYAKKVNIISNTHKSSESSKTSNNRSWVNSNTEETI